MANVAALTLALVSVVAVVPAGAATYRAAGANVSATLTYQGTYPTPHGTTLTIRRDGRVAYRAAVRASFCGLLCWPSPTDGSASASPLRVVRLRAGAPDVVLGLYSGGAHCCYLSEIFSWSSRGYVATEVNWGDPGMRLEVLRGNRYAALVTADDSFAYAFTDYAGSGLPLRILRFDGHRLINVTRQYPSMVRADAASWLAAYRAQASTHYQDSVGVIAAWAADEYLLGRARFATAFLRSEADAGHLRSQLNPGLTGAAFVRQLARFLAQRGY